MGSSMVGELNYVHVDGPVSGGMDENDEFPVWTVAVCDPEGEPVGKVYACRSCDKAKNLGRMMARDRGLELVDEAGW